MNSSTQLENKCNQIKPPLAPALCEEDQTEYLKAFDFDDVVVPGWRVYNVCKAKRGLEEHVAGDISPQNFGINQIRMCGVFIVI